MDNFMDILSRAGAGLTDDIREVVEMYGHMIVSMHKVQALREQGLPSRDEENRFHRLEVRANAMFGALSEAQQRLIVDTLVVQDLMPAQAADMIKTFEARISKC